MDVEKAIAYVQAHGNAVERARLAATCGMNRHRRQRFKNWPPSRNRMVASPTGYQR